MEQQRTSRVSRALSTFTDTIGIGQGAAIGALLFATAVVVAAVFWFIKSAPPRTLIMTSGPPGSAFQRAAEKYRDTLSSNGVTLQILESQGSIENVERLSNQSFRVDIGFVQADPRQQPKGAHLYSLGTVANEPLLIFYRSKTNITLLSGFAGRRLAIGPPGSGTRALALTLLETNGIAPGGATVLLDLDAAEAAEALLKDQVDATFLMGDSASAQTMRTLLRSPGVELFDFAQADAYMRRFPFLNKLQLPRGSIDFGRDVPSHDVTLIGPSVELVARSSLHPGLSDLLIDAAHDAHGNATLLQRKGDFPSQGTQEFKLSPDAARYYESGKGWLYNKLPFWLASLINRVLVAFVPMLLILVPGLRVIPSAYKFRTQVRIYRWYRSLLRVERELGGAINPEKRRELEHRLEVIEKSVHQMKVPASFAGQFYGLREHIGFVREQIGNR